MTLLVFGSTGLLGRAFGPPSRWRVDIRDLKAVRREVERAKPTRIINCAAFTSVDLAETETRRAFEVNAEGAENVARAAREAGVPFVHISTDYVFSGIEAAGQPYTEGALPAPVNAYGVTKRFGEIYVLAENPDAAILRVSGLYSISSGRGLVNGIVRQARSGSMSVIVQRFCPTATEDVARAALIVGPGLWHFAGESVLRHELVRRIVEEMVATRQIPGCVVNVKEIVLPALRPPNCSLDSSKFQAAYGFAARPYWQGVPEALRALWSHA